MISLFDLGLQKLLHGPAWLIPHDRIVMLTAAVLFVAFVGGLFRIDVGMDYVNYLPAKDPTGGTAKLLRRLMGGDSSIPLIVDTNRPNGVKDPELLTKVWNLQQDINKLEHVGYTLSIVSELVKLAKHR